MKKQLSLFIFLFCIIVSYAQTAKKVTLNDSVIAVLKTTILEKSLPGLNFSIILSDGKGFDYSVGFSDIENQKPLLNTHTFFSGSIGKTYAAALVFQLVDQGKIDLNKRLTYYFPDTAWLQRLPNIDGITIKMLLQHTSGLPRYVLKPEIWNQLNENPDKVWTYEERLSVIFGDDAVHEAGKGWAYSDTNYILLGMLIEKIADDDYYNMVETKILTPNKLINTHPSLTREIKNLAVGYSNLPPAFHVPNKTVNDGSYYVNPQFEWTGGGMASTTSDLAKWAKLYYEGELISGESLRLITSPNPNGKHIEGTSSYGMGSFIYETEHGQAYGHTGFMPGYNSIFIYYPDLNIAAAMQINCDYAVQTLNMNKLIDTLVAISKNQ